jgi:hypothetical protein
MLAFDEIWKYLSDVMMNESFGKGSGINIDFGTIEWGDQWYSETGEFFKINMLGSEYELGYVDILEDNENWGQAESHNSKWCHKDGISIKYSELYDKVKNFKELNREYQLSKILD